MAQQGWYPDPQDPRVLRWWDGSAWTTHTRLFAKPPTVPPASRRDQVDVSAEIDRQMRLLREIAEAVEFGQAKLAKLNEDQARVEAEVSQRLADVEEKVSRKRSDVDAELARKHAEFERKVDSDFATKRAQLSDLERDISIAKTTLSMFGPELDAALRVTHAEARLADLTEKVGALQSRHDALKKEVEAVEEAVEIQSFGFYRPKYGFQTGDEYAARLSIVREEQKSMIRRKTAAPCEKEWIVGGSVAEGRRMTDQQTKLMLRAFNGECDAAIAKVKYDNMEKLAERISKAWSQVNALGSSSYIAIVDTYLELKLDELRLVHEHREFLHEEKLEQKRQREELREEERALQELERVQADAEKDERQYAKALDKARADLAKSMGAQHDKLEALVAKLEAELKDALDRKAKAIARAQLTRSGHVYILSNVGSFGEGIYKIGLTRRLDPYERVDELGDASVPFAFDVHAIIFCEDAPALENALHREFADRRVNRINMRKEYFRVTMPEIQSALAKHHGLVSLVLEPEAEEWRKTRAMLESGASTEASAAE